MVKNRDDFRLGVTIVVMFLLFLACLLFIGGEGLRRPKTKPFVVRFSTGPAMPEVVPGSRVTCFGQVVGKVLTTTIVTDADPDDPSVTDRQFLEIRATTLANLDLRDDCRIVAMGPPLGGKGALEIIDPGESAVPLTADRTVYGATTGFQAALAQITAEFDDTNPRSLLSTVKLQLDAADRRSLISKIHASLENLDAITADLHKELDWRQADRLLFKIHAGLDKVNVALTELTAVLHDSRPIVDRTLSSLDHAMRVIDTEVLPNVADELDAGRYGSLLAETHLAFERLNQSLADINTITHSSQRIVLLNAERIDELLRNAAEASMALKNGIKDLAIHPWRLLFQPTAAEKRELHLFNAAREFAGAAADLNAATSRLKAVIDAMGGTIDREDEDLKAVRSNLVKSMERFFEAEQALLRELDVQ